MAEKNYIKGFYKEISTQYGSIFSISINLEELQKLPTDKYGNIKLTMMKRKDIGQYGDTHYMIENDYQGSNNGSAQQEGGNSNSQSEEEDLPF